MAVAPKNVDINLVKKFTPLDTLTLAKVEEILAKSAVQKVPAGRVLFKEGDKDKWTVFLLSGTIQLSSEAGKNETLIAGSPAALKPLAKGSPRPATVSAKNPVSVLIIDTELLDIMVNWNAPGSIEVSDFDADDDSEDDWMSKFLNSNAFIRLPIANMQALMLKLEEVQLPKGKIVVKEGDTEDKHYYIIKQGQCIVSRKDEKSAKQIPLAILKTGVGFGEEAIITGAARGASVSMKTNGVVLKLAKSDFVDLLAKPLIHFISKDDIPAELADNVAYIDVRSKAEFNANGIENSQHCPIRTIRDKIANLDPEMHYVVYSNEENRASSAAFLFIQQGLEVSVLRNGVGKPDIDDSDIEAEPLDETPETPRIDELQEVEEPIESDETNRDAMDHYHKQLLLAEQGRRKAEMMVKKLKLELIKTRELVQKESTIAKNALALAKKADARIKQLEAEIQSLKSS